MFYWRSAGLLAALLVLLPLCAAAQAPREPAAAVPTVIGAGPGVDTREQQGAPVSAAGPSQAAAEGAQNDAASAQNGPKPSPPVEKPPVAAGTADHASDPTPSSPHERATDPQENPGDAAIQPAAKSVAPREAAPVAQPLDIPPSRDTDPGPEQQAAEPAPPELPRRPEDINVTVATWQSAYNEAQKRAMLEPFGADTGYKLTVESHGGDFSELDAARLANSGWDLIELDMQTAARGCDEGWLAPIKPADLPESVEGDPAEADYLPGGLMPCAAASAAWSAVAIFDSRAAFDAQPSSIAALFDLPRFPGKRALPRRAPYLLEFALMADGVPPEQVYDVLATGAGQDRAFAKLSSIRHAIVWWSDPAAALDLFPAGAPDSAEDVVMGIAFNGRVFTDVVRRRGALRTLWDGHIHQFNYWAVPKSAPEPDTVRKLLSYVSMPERQARLTRWFPYGPPRRSALPLVGQHAEIDLDMAAFVPTMPRNMERTLRFDPAWWQTHGASLKQRFAKWLALPAPSAPANQFIPPTPVKAERVQPAMTVQ